MIRELRDTLDLTVEEAALRVGVTIRQWSHWEAGDRTPSGPAAMMLDLLRRKKI